MRYETEPLAQAALETATMGQQRAYFCWRCQGWHLTTLALTDPAKSD